MENNFCSLRKSQFNRGKIFNALRQWPLVAPWVSGKKDMVKILEITYTFETFSGVIPVSVLSCILLWFTTLAFSDWLEQYPIVTLAKMYTLTCITWKHSKVSVKALMMKQKLKFIIFIKYFKYAGVTSCLMMKSQFLSTAQAYHAVRQLIVCYISCC